MKRKRTRLATTSRSCAILRPRDVEAAKTAYADASNSPGERNLQWKGTGSFAPSDFCRLAKAAVPNGYNEFDADKVCAVVQRHPKVCFRLGREYSVTVYASGTKAALEKLKRKQSALRADEADIHRGRLRLWWD